MSAGLGTCAYDVVVTDAASHRVCTARLTCLIRDQVLAWTETALVLQGNNE